MPVTQFNDAMFLPNGDLAVSGPFDAENAKILGDVLIMFMLLQEPENPGAGLVILKGMTLWRESEGPSWQHTVPHTVIPEGLRVGPVRCVGAAVVVRVVDHEPVPFIDAITWCVQKEIGQIEQPAAGTSSEG
jgi:hypothetical protein